MEISGFKPDKAYILTIDLLLYVFNLGNDVLRSVVFHVWIVIPVIYGA